jgi:hypothetical protein
MSLEYQYEKNNRANIDEFVGKERSDDPMERRADAIHNLVKKARSAKRIIKRSLSPR